MKVNAHVLTIEAGMDGKTGRGQMIGQPKEHEEAWVHITSVVRLAIY